MLIRLGSGRGQRARSALVVGVSLLAAALILGSVAVFVGAGATVLAAGGTLWLVLFLLVRQLRRERESAEARVSGLRESYNCVIGVLAAALGLSDSVMTEHSRQVSQLASAVARQMGLSREQVALVQKAALLHDIGKTGIADGILSKPTALTESEWAEMKRHPDIGYEILISTDHLRDAAEIVRAHHERFDGQGYPQRLRGEEIPIGSRIFAIVDAYAAMTSDRPYRKKMPHDIAVKEILRASLTQFDPEVVRAFLAAEEQGLLGRSSHAEAGGNRAAPVPNEV